VANGDVKALSGVSGVGKKTAERIVVELKDKLGDGTDIEFESGASVSPENQKMADAIAALEALGSKPKDAQDAIRAAIAMLGPDKPVDELVRAALQKGK
jgi:Holliday junction DNA helicase RuvA